MSGRAAAVFALALLLAAPTAFALSDAGKKSYLAGVRALDDQEYEAAVKKLREAIQDDAQEGIGKFRGTGVAYEDYFPHLYLGLALEKAGRAAEAEREIEESQRQGFSKKRSGPAKALAASLQRLQSVAVAQVHPTAPPPPPPTPTPRPAPTATPTPAAPAARPTSTARATATPVPAPAATAAPSLIRIPPPRVAPPSEELLADMRSGIRAYFRGDFAGAMRLLEKRRGESATARLFFAYALAGKCLLDGPARDEKLLARAREEYRAARTAGAPVREDRLISRAVRTMLEQG